jgi:transposase
LSQECSGLAGRAFACGCELATASSQTPARDEREAYDPQGRRTPAFVGCPRVLQSGSTDRRGPISKHGPRYLRWGLFEAAMNACKHPLYKERYQHTKRRLGRQRGPKVAQIDLSRRLTEAIWHMLTRDEPFAPAGAGFRLAA